MTLLEPIIPCYYVSCEVFFLLCYFHVKDFLLEVLFYCFLSFCSFFLEVQSIQKPLASLILRANVRRKKVFLAAPAVISSVLVQRFQTTSHSISNISI